MEQSDSSSAAWIVAVVFIILFLSYQDKLTKIKETLGDKSMSNKEVAARVRYLDDDYNTCKYNLNDVQDQLEEKNRRLEEANDAINEAKGYAWSSYDDMGSALDDLEEK